MTVVSYPQSQSPGSELISMFHSKSAERQGAFNFAGIKDEKIDKIIDKIIYTEDRDEMIVAAKVLDRLLWNDFYLIPNWFINTHRIAYYDEFKYPKKITSLLPSYKLYFTNLVKKMIIYIFKRLLLMIPTLLGILFLTFLIIQFVPGGPVEQLVNKLSGLDSITESSSSTNLYRGSNGLTEEHIAQLNKFYGFDKSFTERFLIMISNYSVFDLGESYFHNQSVSELIISKLPVSISLGVWSFLNSLSGKYSTGH